MKKTAWSIVAAAAVMLSANAMMAQQEGDGDRPDGEQREGDRPRGERGPRDGEGPRGERGPRDGEGPRGERGPRDGERPRDGEGRGRGPRDGRPGGGPPEGRGGFGMNPLLAILDTDRDGKISSSEIDQAVAVLRKMDKNGDGDLTREELGPMGPPEGRGGFGGPGFAGRPGGFGGGRPEGGPPGAFPGGFGGRRPEGGPGGPGGFGPEQMIARIMEGDTDSDGKISKEEARGPLQRGFDDADENGDGYLDKSELESMANKFAERMREGGFGRGGRRPGGDGEGRPPRGREGEGGERRRPEAE